MEHPGRVQHPLTDSEIAEQKLKSYEAVLARLESLENRVSELEAK